MLINMIKSSPLLSWGDMSKFLKQTKDQIAAHELLGRKRKFSPKLFSLRALLADRDIESNFLMFESLSLPIFSPVDGSPIRAILREYNSLDIICYSPLVPYSIVFEDCLTGIELLSRLRKAKLLAI